MVVLGPFVFNRRGKRIFVALGCAFFICIVAVVVVVCVCVVGGGGDGGGGCWFGFCCCFVLFCNSSGEGYVYRGKLGNSR